MLESLALALVFHRWPIPLLLAIMLTGCATPTQHAADHEAPIRARYQQARIVYQQRMAPLAQYFVANCAPLADDRQYLDCINGKRAEMAAQSIYPEQTAQQRLLLESEFLEGRLDRKQLRTRLENLRLDDEALQLSRDLAAGNYSGRY